MLRTRWRSWRGSGGLVGLAPSASAAHVLAGEADIPARTLQGFLTRYRDVGDGIASPERTEEARQALGGAVLILDEASMVGSVQMRALTRIAAQTDVARLALIGDRRQLRAVEAGQPFGLLQDAGMPTARMDEVVRQRDADSAGGCAAHGGGRAASGGGRAWQRRPGDGERRARPHRRHNSGWISFRSLRAGTAILAPTHELRAEINAAVRQGLEEEGRAVRPRAGDRALCQPATDTLAEGRSRKLPAGRRRGLPSQRLRRQCQGRRCLPRAGGGGWGCTAGPSRRQGAAHRPGRLHPLPARPLRNRSRWSSELATGCAGPATISRVA